MFCEHLPGGEAHDAAPHRREHPELEAGEGDGGSAQACGHEQRRGDGHLARVLSDYQISLIMSIFQMITLRKHR